MGKAIYLLCALTSILCAALLIRGYFNSRARLLLYAGFCFAMLAVNNALLFIDLVIYSDTDLFFFKLPFALVRGIIALLGLSILLWGLIWDSNKSRPHTPSPPPPSARTARPTSHPTAREEIHS